MKDFFKPVPHDQLFERYLVSKDGKILSKYDNKNRLRPDPKIRKTQIQPNGYERCYLSWTKKEKSLCARVWIHQAVCQAFNGPRPSGLHEVAHLDGNCLNNNADNLSWVTKKENAAHKNNHGTNLIRDKNHQTKIDSRMQKAIYRLHKQYYLSQSDLAVIFEVSSTAIHHALKTLIEKIPKEPCKHAPIITIYHGSDGQKSELSLNEVICKHCGVELIAEWKEKKNDL